MADFIFDHFDDLISYNSAELAQRAACRKPPSAGCLSASVTTNIRDMRDELRTLRQSGMPLTDQRDAVQGKHAAGAPL